MFIGGGGDGNVAGMDQTIRSTEKVIITTPLYVQTSLSRLALFRKKGSDRIGGLL